MKVLPENILSRMSPADRKAVGQMTSTEAQEKYEAGEERKLQNHIANFLAHVQPPPYAHKAPFNKRAQGKPGRADFVICYRGRWISFEAKAPGGKQSPEQIQHQAEIERAGGIYVVVRSLGDVQAVLRQVDAEIRICQEALEAQGWTEKISAFRPEVPS